MYQHSLSLSLSHDVQDHSLRASLGRSFDKSIVKAKPTHNTLLIASNIEPAQKAQCSSKVVYSIGAVTFFILLCIGVVTFIFIANPANTTDMTLDRQWFNDLILSENIDQTNLSHGLLFKQLDLYQPQQGIYRIHFDQYWTYTGIDDTLQISLNAQSGIIYNFANAYVSTAAASHRFLDAMYDGLQALLTVFYDETYGGYYQSVTKYENGTYVIGNPNKDSYEFSFAIKAFAKAYEATLNETYLEKATEIHEILLNNFRDFTSAGLYSVMNRNMTQNIGNTKSDQNMLHYFHALMKLYEAYTLFYESNEIVNGPMLSEINVTVNAVYDFMMSVRVNTTFSDSGEYLVLAAEYDQNWTANEPLNENVNFGHNFEWSLFIWQCIEMGIIQWNDTNEWNANNIFDYSLYMGYNESLNVFDSGTQGSQWWVGIEALRTVIYFYYQNPYRNYRTSELFELMNNAQNGYNSVYFDAEYGGVYANPFEGNYYKSANNKVGYHVAESCFDILQWTMSVK